MAISVALPGGRSKHSTMKLQLKRLRYYRRGNQIIVVSFFRWFHRVLRTRFGLVLNFIAILSTKIARMIFETDEPVHLIW